MAQACKQCGGLGYVNDAPCPRCVSEFESRDERLGEYGPPDKGVAGVVSISVTVVDSDEERDPNEQWQGPEGLFNPSEIAARNAADLARMAKAGRGLKAMEDRKEVP